MAAVLSHSAEVGSVPKDDDKLYGDNFIVADSGTQDAASRQLYTYADSQRLKRKVDWHLLPPLFFAYLIKNCDQNMASYAKAINSGTSESLLHQLHMSSNTFSYASTAFYITYILFEVPSNMTIRWATPRLHLVRILALWSVIAACHAACQNATGYLACRALLGAAEAGFYPGILYYFNCWYRPDEMSFRLLAIGTLGQFSGVVDTLIAYGFSFVGGSVAGWRYCYIVIGACGFLVALWMWYILPDWPNSPPSRRQFLSESEAEFMAARLPPSASSISEDNVDWVAIRQELKSPLLYLYGICIHFLAAGTTGLTFWLPTIIQEFKLTSSTQSLLLNVPPAILYVIVQLSVGWFLDNDTRVPRHLILIACSAMLVCGYIGLILIKSAAGLYAMIFVVYIPYACYYGMIYPLRTQSLKPGSSAFALGFMNAVGAMPGVYTAQIFRSKYAPRYVVPFVVCMVLVACAGLAAAVTWYFAYGNEKQTRLVARKRRQEGQATGRILDDEVF